MAALRSPSPGGGVSSNFDTMIRIVLTLVGGAAALRAGVPAMRMPAAVLEKIPAEVRANAIFAQATEANWNALRECFPSDEAGLAAIDQSLAVILPYGADTPISGFMEMGYAINRADNIAGSYNVLKSKFDGDADAVLEVLTKNPGVLGCLPAALQNASATDIQRAATFADVSDSVFAPARRFLQSTSWWDEGKSNLEKPKDEEPAFDPLGFLGDFKKKEDEAEDDELLLPPIVIDGTEYMYDQKGECGIEQVILNMESEPVAVWNPETGVRS